MRQNHTVEEKHEVNNETDAETEGFDSYEAEKPTKHKKYYRGEDKKYYFPKYESSLDVVQPPNATNYTEDSFTEDEADRITEVKKTLYTIEEYDENPPNNIEYEPQKEVAMKITQSETPEIHPMIQAGADENIKFKSVLILYCIVFLRFLF